MNYYELSDKELLDIKVLYEKEGCSLHPVLVWELKQVRKEIKYRLEEYN